MTQEDLGKKRIYNSAFKSRGREDVVLWDVFPVKDGEVVKLTFEAIKSPWRQGVWLRTDKGILVNDLLCKSVELWQDTAPAEVFCTCLSSDGFLSVYNVWDSGRGYGMESQAASSGMLVEQIPNGCRYRCNDIGFNTDFQKLVFTVERVAK